MDGGRGGDPGNLRVPNRQQEASSRVSPATAPHEWELTKEKGTALSAVWGSSRMSQNSLWDLVEGPLSGSQAAGSWSCDVLETAWCCGFKGLGGP